MKSTWPRFGVASRRNAGRRRLLAGWLGLLLALAPWLANCGGVAPVVKVGLVGPFEGRQRALGYDVLYSARLAVREIDAAGGVAGTRVALVALDDGGDPELAAQTAAALVVDPDVVAVVGHWLPETTMAAEAFYAAAGMPFIPAGRPPFGPSDPGRLPPAFHDAYEAVTPFDEKAGERAGAAYDAFQLLWLALEQAKESEGTISRGGVAKALVGLEYKGLTGRVYQP